jgi:hypothetical protein
VTPVRSMCTKPLWTCYLGRGNFMRDGFPNRSVVLPGSVLGYLVDSIVAAQWAGATTFASWEDKGLCQGIGHAVYGMSDGQGIYGAIILDKNSLVGLFYDSRSDRTPYLHPDSYDLNRFFQGMSPLHRTLAVHPLHYFVEHVDDKYIPAVTTAFWNEGEYLTAADPWEVVLAHGARLARKELIADIDEAFVEWQEEYELTPEQLALARSLFNRKMAQPMSTIELTQAEVGWLRTTTEGRDEKGMIACREKLAAIGILLPQGISRSTTRR